MRQQSTSLAWTANGRETTATERVHPPRAMPADEPVVPLHGVMTGLANLVNEHLTRLTIGPQATRFLRHLERQTFGNAGLHRRAGRQDPGLWCPYVHAQWAVALELSSSALTHLRTRLIEAGIIWYTPDPACRGEGAVGWNFDFAAWRPPLWGGARAGAGRPRTRSGARQVTPVTDWKTTQHAASSLAQPGTADEVTQGDIHLRGSTHRRPLVDAANPDVHAATERHGIQDGNPWRDTEPADEFKTPTRRIQDVNERQSSHQQAQFKTATAQAPQTKRCQTAATHTRRRSLKNEQKQRQEGAEANSTCVDRPTPTPPTLAAVAPPPMPPAPPPHAHPPDHPATLPRAQLLRKARRSACADGDDGSLPAPQPYETLCSYWLRIYREASATAGKEASDLVYRAARMLLNMGHSRKDDLLLERLHQMAGSWATVLQWVVECAAWETADPRTAIVAIATRGQGEPSGEGHAERESTQSRTTTVWRDQGDVPANGTATTRDWDPPDRSAYPSQQGAQGACSMQTTTHQVVLPTGHMAITQHEEQREETCRRSLSPDRVNGSQRAPGNHTCAHADSRHAEHLAQGDEFGEDSLGRRDDCAVTLPREPMWHLWLLVRQRLRANLTQAQFSSWLVNTKLYRTSDSTLVLVTHSAYAAELIDLRWGERIRQIIHEITGQDIVLTIRAQGLGAEPNG